MFAVHLALGPSRSCLKPGSDNRPRARHVGVPGPCPPHAGWIGRRGLFNKNRGGHWAASLADTLALASALALATNLRTPAYGLSANDPSRVSGAPSMALPPDDRRISRNTPTGSLSPC